MGKTVVAARDRLKEARRKMDTFLQWRREVRETAKERFFTSHQWPTIWIETVVTAVGAAVAGMGWGAVAFWQTAIPGLAIGAVLLLGFLLYDVVFAPHWLATNRNCSYEDRMGELKSKIKKRNAQIDELEMIIELGEQREKVLKSHVQMLKSREGG